MLGYELCDRLTEALLYALILFCPWAFGTTPTWAMHIANAIGYALGLLLLAKWIIRWRSEDQPHRYGRTTGLRDYGTAGRGDYKTLPSRSPAVPPSRSLVVPWSRSLTAGVAFITVALLAQCLISALNARATYSYDTNTFDYHTCIRWLPHSYDAASTWIAFWNYLAWAAAFWALRDWLLGLSDSDLLARSRARSSSPFALRPSPFALRPLPPRLQRLLWVLSLNGALLALEAILQQTSGTNKLLWFQDTYYNRDATAQFGPFPYRSNGAQYVNLIWPVTLGFWAALQRARIPGQGTGGTRHHLLLACILVMIAAPTMTLSRGAVLVAAANVVAASGLLLLSARRRQSLGPTLAILVLLVAGFASGVYAVWDKLEARMSEMRAGFEGREQMTIVGRKMAAEAPPFGTGAETLQPLYQLYKGGADEYWPGQLHNDWLETRITFGLVGFSLILCGLMACVARWRFGDGIPVSWRFTSFVWLAMTGCLVHARWDLPFQVYAITLLFLLYCSLLLSLSHSSS